MHHGKGSPLRRYKRKERGAGTFFSLPHRLHTPFAKAGTWGYFCGTFPCLSGLPIGGHGIVARFPQVITDTSRYLCPMAGSQGTGRPLAAFVTFAPKLRCDFESISFVYFLPPPSSFSCSAEDIICRSTSLELRPLPSPRSSLFDADALLLLLARPPAHNIVIDVQIPTNSDWPA